jgi:hypothetical protein
MPEEKPAKPAEILPPLNPEQMARTNVVKERCDALVLNARREHDALMRAAERAGDNPGKAARLRRRAREVLRKAQDLAAVQLLDVEAGHYLPMTGDHFPDRTLPILAHTATQMYGGEDAVTQRMKEWRAQWWDRKADSEKPTERMPQSPSIRQADDIAAERKELLQAYKSEGARVGIRITDKMIAEAASGTWHERTPVQRWKRNSPRSTPADDVRIRAVLKKKPHLK